MILSALVKTNMGHIDLMWKISTFCDTVWCKVPKMVFLDALCCPKFFRHFFLCAWECCFPEMSHLVDVSMKIQLAHKFSPCFNDRQKIKFWKIPILKGFIFDCKAASYKLPTNEKIHFFFSKLSISTSACRITTINIFRNITIMYSTKL